MASKERICIGFGDWADCCTRRITDEALELNGSGLWCVRCEKARRKHLDGQFAAISASFEEGGTHAAS